MSNNSTFHPISTGHNEVLKVEVNDCDGEVCVLHKSKPLNMKSTFVSNQDTAKLELKVTANIGGLELPVPGIDSDGCKVVKCPLKKGETYTTSYSQMLPSITPKGRTTVTARLIGDHGPVVCSSVVHDIQD